MRLMLKRPLTDLWLDLDVEAHEINYTKVLNGPGDITVRLPHKYQFAKGEDGGLLVSEYETLMIVETEYDGLVVALVDNIEVTEADIQVSGAGLSVIAKDIPWWLEEKKYADANPIDVFKDIWNHILSYDQAKVGLKITGDNACPGTIGIPPTALYVKADSDVKRIEVRLASNTAALKSREADLVEATKTLFKACGLYTVGQVKWQASAPSTTKNIVWIESDNMNQAKVYKKGSWVLKTGINVQIKDYISKKSDRDKAAALVKADKDALSKAKEVLNGLSEEKGETYDLSWWETTDLSQKISELTLAGPFEYVERAKWDGDDLDLSIEVGSPRIGTRREDLVFELGVNVTAIPNFKQVDPYTDVVVFGAGEGSTKVAAGLAFQHSRRVRRVDLWTDKDAKTEQLAYLAGRERMNIHARKLDYGFDTVVVSDHHWAKTSQYDVGDEIHVSGLTPYNMQFNRWVRIKEITVSSATTDIVLKVEVV